MSLSATFTPLLNTSRDGDTSWAAFSGDWHPFQSPLFPLRVNGVSRTSKEGISVHFSPTSPLALWVAGKVTVLVVSISFRVATYSFKTAGVKIPWKLSSKCYKALYSILSIILTNLRTTIHVTEKVWVDQPRERGDLWTPETLLHVVTDNLC